MLRRLVSRLPVTIILAGVIAAAGLSACSEKDRHAVLDVIFDGVPPYIPPEDRARLRTEAEAQALDKEQQEQAKRAARAKVVRKISRFTHGPFAAKECGNCHDLAASSGFRTSGSSLTSMPGIGGELAEAGRLRMPVVKLCVRCHSDYSPQAPENAGLRMHGPVGVGWCVACHQAHSSAYQHLVHADPPAKLCTQCHQRSDLLEFTPEHQPTTAETAYPPSPELSVDEPGTAEDKIASLWPQSQVAADCTRCHDPHRGLNRFLLKASALRSSPSSASGNASGAGSLR